MNIKNCAVYKDNYKEVEPLKHCPFCKGNKVELYIRKCDRIGWENGWEPEIICDCGALFSVGFFGIGCDEKWIEKIIVGMWNNRT